MPEFAPQLDVVIVNWNTDQQLRGCLGSIAALAQQETQRIRKIIVVDNASSDGSQENIPSIPAELVVIRNMSNLGFAVACNQGAQRGSAEYLLFLNPDTVLLTGALSGPLDYMSGLRGSQIGICGIQLLDTSATISRSCSRFPTLGRLVIQAFGFDRIWPNNFRAMSMREWDHSETREVDQVIGAFFLVRRQLYDTLGGFDERYFVYFEEVDFSIRAKKMGYASTYLTGPKAIHIGHGSSRNIRARALFYNLRSRLKFAHKHFALSGFVITFVFTLSVEPVARIVGATLSLSLKKARDTIFAYGLLYADVAGSLVRSCWRLLPR